MSQSNNQLVTILMPTFNKKEQFYNNINYIASNADFSKIKLIILDGSDEDIAEINKKNSLIIPEASYFYYSSNHYTFFERLYDGSKKVETAYVMVLADDDRVDFNGLLECVDFLQKNQDYAAAQGQYKMFESRKGKIIDIGDIYLSDSYDDDNKFLRIQKLFSNYCINSLYTLQRTQNYKRFMDCVSHTKIMKIQLLSSREYEMAHGVTLLLSGKMKRLSSLYYKRQSEKTSLPTWHLELMNDVKYVCLNKNFLPYCYDMHRIVQNYMKDSHDYDESEITQMVIQTLYIYYSKGILTVFDTQSRGFFKRLSQRCHLIARKFSNES